MALDTETKIALLGISVSALFAAVGLILNFLAVRKNNRITVSTKLVEASKLLSNELMALVHSYKMYKSELQSAQAHPDSGVRTTKIANLEKLIEDNLARQKENDKLTDQIDSFFHDLDGVDPGAIDKAISFSYRKQSLALSSLEFSKEVKNRNS